MNGDRRETPPDRDREAFTSSGGWDREAHFKSNRPKKTQRQKVLELLLEGWVCGTRFYREYLPRATARIYELRQDGYYVPRRRCQNPTHNHDSVQWEWRIEGVPDAPEDEPCPGCGSSLTHTSGCRFKALARTEGTLFPGGDLL